MLSRDQLLHAAGEAGFATDTLEKVWLLVRLLNGLFSHPYLSSRIALKGGTALNLFVLELPRLSVDIDINYIGSAEVEAMLAERPRVEKALGQVVGSLGMMVRRTPTEHAGGKWRLAYQSALGRPAILEVDVNFLLRVPLWDPVKRDSHSILDVNAVGITILEEHELAAGKLAALLARGASRDLFDARELLSRAVTDVARLRQAFVVYGGMSRTDWRTVRAEDVKATSEEIRQQLLPMLRRGVGPQPGDVDSWSRGLVDQTRDLLDVVLPLSADEVAFLERLNEHGEITPELITHDEALQQRIRVNPGLAWKALNVQERRR